MMLIQCLSLANGEAGPAGQYLAGYNPDTGFSKWTYDKAEAMQFAHSDDAWVFWTQVKANEPVRPDGRPNRPLTAFTVEITQEEE